jgi:hypothetical protein
MSIRYLANKQRAYQAPTASIWRASAVFGRSRRPRVLKGKWSEVEVAAAEVADARWDYKRCWPGVIGA